MRFAKRFLVLVWLEMVTCLSFAVLLSSSALLATWASAQLTMGGINIGHDESSGVYSPSYSISSKTDNQNGKCIELVTVKGKGVDDTYEKPCSNRRFDMLSTDKGLVLGAPKDYSFGLYSEEPSTMVVMKNGKCIKKMYTTTSKGTSSTSSEVSDKDCTLIKQKMEDEREKNRIYWEEWNKNFNQQMANTFNNQPDMSVNPVDDPTWSSSDNDFVSEGFEGNNEEPSGSSDNSYVYEESEDHHVEDETADDSDIDDYAGNMSNFWSNWGKTFSQNMQQTMNKAFPPGFPFNKQ